MSKSAMAWRGVIWYVPLVVSGLVASHLAAVTIYHMEYLGVSCTYLYVIAGAGAVFGGLSYLMRRRQILKLWVIPLVVVGGFALFPDQGGVIYPVCIPGEYAAFPPGSSRTSSEDVRLHSRVPDFPVEVLAPNPMLNPAGSDGLAPDASAIR